MLINHEKLKGFAQAVFERLGAQPDKAFETADHLVEANLKGHDSHGVGMIPNYVGSALRGGLQVNADARVVKDQGAVLLVDGGFGFGTNRSSVVACGSHLEVGGVGFHFV